MGYIHKIISMNTRPFVELLAKNLCHLNALFEKIPNAELTQWMAEFFAGLDVCIMDITSKSMDRVRKELERWINSNNEQVKEEVIGSCLSEVISCLFALRPIPFLPNEYIVVPDEDTLMSWIINVNDINKPSIIIYTQLLTCWKEISSSKIIHWNCHSCRYTSCNSAFMLLVKLSEELL